MNRVHAYTAVLFLLSTPFTAAAELSTNIKPYSHRGPYPLEYVPTAISPACFERFGALILRCQPQLYIHPYDAPAFVELGTVAPRPSRPYQSLFSWPYGN
jgi:hypothetical protein